MFEGVKKFLPILTLLCLQFCPYTGYSNRPIYLGRTRPITDSIANIRSISRKKKTIRSHIYLAAAGRHGYIYHSLVALSNAWYKDYPQSSFHFFNDNDDWLQVDKAGHVFSAYTTGKWSMEMWRWAGLSKKQRIWVED
jgi:hypothetical protein